MQSGNLDLLACPACRLPLVTDVVEAMGNEVLTGSLSCTKCAVQIPILRGFVLFTEADIEAGDPDTDHVWFGSPDEYAEYHRVKFSRDQLEMYAAFHPFNEATRAGEAMLPLLDVALRPGDAILDPWSRTGWNAVHLAHRFPEQRVIALVEGNRDVLGYRGVAHWLAHGTRPANLDVMFVHPASGLPFRDAVFAAVYSHDCLHRFPMQALGSNLLRVAAAQAPLVFAHTHLSNSEPDPWFDRGCTIRHGRVYRNWLDQICAGSQREGRILSEAELFEVQTGALPPDSWNMTHYNALVVVADAKALRDVRRTSDSIINTTRFLVNPLCRLHLGRRSIRIERANRNGMVGEMLDRHPVYHKRLPSEPLLLAPVQLAMLALALIGSTLAEIIDTLGITRDSGIANLEPLLAVDILRAVPVSRQSLAMQRFHANQLPPVALLQTASIASLANIDTVLRGGDGSEIDGADMPSAVNGIRYALASFGIEQGARIALGIAPSPMMLLVLLAALDLGCDLTFDQPGEPSDYVLVDATGVPDTRGRTVIAMGWDGEAGTLIGALPTHVSTDLGNSTGSGQIYVSIDGTSVGFSQPVLLEMALSLSNVTGSVGCGIARPDTIEGLLACIIALIGGQSITIAA